jgi:F-type H+-transporting ATPase subunit gamma
MTRLAEIEAHIASMGELLDIVGAMRSLASMRVQEAHNAVPGVRRYAETMAAAVGAALLLGPGPVQARPTRERRALVLCMGEHGFAGGFNERVIDAAEALLPRGVSIFVLGTRGAALAEERGWPAIWTHPMATRPAAAPELVRRLTTELFRAIGAGGVTHVDIVFARHRQGDPPTIERRVLFPVDLSSLAVGRPRLPPLHHLSPEKLLERLVADYVLALLIEAVIESISSENQARFAAMAAAHDNVETKLRKLHQDGRQARQEEITTELLDLVTGAKALDDAERHDHSPWYFFSGTAAVIAARKSAR